MQHRCAVSFFRALKLEEHTKICEVLQCTGNVVFVIMLIFVKIHFCIQLELSRI